MTVSRNPLAGVRVLPWLTVVLAVATVVAIVAIDRPMARYYADHGVEARADWTRIRVWIDTNTGIDVHKWFAAIVLGGVGVLWALHPRTRGSARVWFFAIAVHVVTRLVTTELKPAFGRLRPSQWIERGGASFGEGGISFPSGHATFYLGLIAPFAIAWPRVGVPLLIVPGFVAWSRVAVNAHFVGDILGSAALVALVSWLFALAFRIDGRPGWKRT